MTLSSCNTKYHVFFEPTDIRKATKPFQITSRSSLKFISPNLNELSAIGKFLGYDKNLIPSSIDSVVDIGKYISEFVDNSIITMGKNGVLIIRKNAISNEIQIRHYGVKMLSEIASVSGAGDCFASGFIYAMLSNNPEEVCMTVGFEAARMSILSTESVPEVLFDNKHECWTTKSDYRVIIA